MCVPINSVYIDGQSNSESWTLEWQISLNISETGWEDYIVTAFLFFIILQCEAIIHSFSCSGKNKNKQTNKHVFINII